MNRGKEKGKSHSTRPVRVGIPKWLRLEPEEIEDLVAELARKGVPDNDIQKWASDAYSSYIRLNFFN